MTSEAQAESERRKGQKDRRANTQDRRNEDRVAEESEPRRSPEQQDRRCTHN